MGTHTFFIGWLWEKTPGAWWLKLIQWVVVSVIVMLIFLQIVYPTIASHYYDLG